MPSSDHTVWSSAGVSGAGEESAGGLVCGYAMLAAKTGAESTPGRQSWQEHHIIPSLTNHQLPLLRTRISIQNTPKAIQSLSRMSSAAITKQIMPRCDSARSGDALPCCLPNILKRCARHVADDTGYMLRQNDEREKWKSRRSAGN